AARGLERRQALVTAVRVDEVDAALRPAPVRAGLAAERGDLGDAPAVPGRGAAVAVHAVEADRRDAGIALRDGQRAADERAAGDADVVRAGRGSDRRVAARRADRADLGDAGVAARLEPCARHALVVEAGAARGVRAVLVHLAVLPEGAR